MLVKSLLKTQLRHCRSGDKVSRTVFCKAILASFKTVIQHIGKCVSMSSRKVYYFLEGAYHVRGEQVWSQVVLEQLSSFCGKHVGVVKMLNRAD